MPLPPKPNPQTQHTAAQRTCNRFWSFGDGNFSDEANPTHTYAATGNYFFTLSLQNNSTGCAQNFTGFIHITAGNAATQPNLGDN